MISIEKINHTYIRVYSEQHIEQELSQFFQFRVEGYKFTPAYKSGQWDGYIRLYNLQKKTLYVGLLDYVLTFAKNNEYEVKYLNEVVSTTVTSLDDIKEYCKWLDLHTRSVPIELRHYQFDAVHHIIENERALILSPTSSGKSAIIYSAIRYHLEQGRKCMIVVPTTQLVEQLYSDFEDYSSANGWKVDRHCQKLYSGFPKHVEADVLISTWQSSYKQPAAWFNQFDVVVCDEAHLAAAKSLTSILEKMIDVQYRIGLTGTLSNSKTNKLVLEGLFGTVYKVISTKELMDQGSVVNLKIKCLILKYDEITRKTMKGMPYQKEMDFLVDHSGRNKFIRNLAASCEGNTLVLFNYVERHGVPLYEMIKRKVGDTREVILIHGGIKTEDRELARITANEQSNVIIVASYATMSTGVNIPSIQNVIFASSSKSKIRNLQSIGRGLRLKDGKTHCNLFDIADDLHWKSWKNHTLNHLQERIKTYAEEKFQYKIIEVELEK